ncbi:MBOAT family O-acyltransferase [Limnoglobus roseus]|uniref:MBOAT family protein n=1 Tax=Limnoglobus roseus TaxID=2598579 RepID=A0A5C1A4E0_9BACT|nr:MBOAT family protein [Limnoglobus roseus]QEL13183.1 MBOAT family protein [Limnoglobus roseus]
MYFQSQTFLHIFLPLVLLAYYAVPVARVTIRNAVLFAASLFFYAWGEREFVAILFGSLVVNFGFAHAIERFGRKKLTLTVAVLSNLALLGWLKYAGFLAATLGYSLPAQHLPIGVSFFTFQAISYCVDVYRREVPAERSFLRFGVYVFLFPHLIAGPIVRYADLAESLATRDHTLDRFADGVRRFTMGLAKKILIADTLAVVADQVFRLPPQELAASAAWVGMLCYALQIYFDFSGYSDMAIGLGKLFGFEFAENFRYPYSAASVTDFWRRWHISLSSWFRDYVYIPLGGNRGGAFATYRNLLIVFVLCGLWHGANWTFLVWGAWHGGFLILERVLASRKTATESSPSPPALRGRGRGEGADVPPRGAMFHQGEGSPPHPNPLPLKAGGEGTGVAVVGRHVYALIVVLFGWVFFRSQTLAQATGIFAALFGLTDGTHIAGDVMTHAAGIALAVGAFISVPVFPWLKRQGNLALVAVPLLAVLLLLATAGIAGSTYSAFIYFRF